ncbi:MAG: hypothetical protein ACKOZU_07725 [Planctomycetaceae bacterium]
MSHLPSGIRSIARAASACLAALALAAAGVAPAADEPADAPAGTAAAAAEGGFAAFLADKGIDRAGRAAIEEATVWSDAVQQAAVRVLLRLAAPAELVARWRVDAVEFGAAPPAVDDRLVAVRGRAVFVAPHPLTPEQRDLAAGRTHFDVVRIVDAAGAAVEVLVLEAPKAWARGRAIDEPAVAFGLPLSTKIRPGPADAAESSGDAPALLVAAPAVSWIPATPLGKLGMDYALFDTVADGRRLEPGDTQAFFAMLAAAAQAPEAPAGKPTDIVPLIDPTQKWFASHRGDEVVIAGMARRATRISIDDPVHRSQAGTDHYWELFVFVPTPPLSVNGSVEDDFPVVCCVRELPPGMPTGDQISESVVVPGFALKRYGYPLADAVIGDDVRKGQRLETPLVLARRAIWRQPPSTRGASDALFGIFAALAALVAVALAWGSWSMRRDARRAEARARAELPERIDIPGGRD